MKGKEFIEIIERIKGLDLLGYKSHKKIIGDLNPFFSPLEIKDKNPRHSGVLLLFFERENKIKFLLEQRNIYNGIHSGQISLVGGKKEENDISIQETAIRETQEETQIEKENIKIIKEISTIYIPPSNFLVFPFIGILKNLNPVFKNTTNEVKEFIEVEIEDLLDDKNIVEIEVETNYLQKKKKTLAFILNKKEVWGATAMILQEFKDLFLKINK